MTSGYTVYYTCPRCEHQWDETWSCACDSECPGCGAKNIEAVDWKLDGTKTQEELDAYNGVTA